MAAPAVSLPLGEDAARWADAVTLAGLELGPVGPVTLVDEGSDWVVRAVGPDGTRREARVPAPRTAREREELLVLAAALLRAVGAPDAPGARPVVVAPPPPPPPRPRPERTPPPSPTPTRPFRVQAPFADELMEVRAWTVPEPPSAPAPVPVVPPPAPPPGWRPGVSVFFGVEQRRGLDPTPALGGQLRPLPWVGAQVRGTWATAISPSSQDREVSHVVAEGLVGPRSRWARVELGFGGARHGVRARGREVAANWVTAWSGAVGLHGPWSATPGLLFRVGSDLERLYLAVPGVAEIETYSPWSWSLALSGDIAPRSARGTDLFRGRATSRSR